MFATQEPISTKPSSERLNYDRLYQEALSDPELKRTRVELEAALSNSREAREVVFHLFQDLEGFSLDDYKPFSDVTEGMDRLVRFLATSAGERWERIVKANETTFDLLRADGSRIVRFTRSREDAAASEELDLMGLDHDLMERELAQWRTLPPESAGLAVRGNAGQPILLSCWLVESVANGGERRVAVQTIAVTEDGVRVPIAEKQADQYFSLPPTTPPFTPEHRLGLFEKIVEPSLQRELRHRGAGSGDGSYSAELITYLEVGE